MHFTRSNCEDGKCEADIMPKRRKIVEGAGDSGATYKRRGRPSKHANFNRSMARAGTQEYSQVSQKVVEDVEDGGGVEELVDSIIHDLEQENLEKANEEVVVEQHDEVTEGQHDDEVTEGQHDEEEGQHDDEVTEGQQDDEEIEGQNMSNLAGGRRNKLEVFGKILETSTP
ncbi:hypothetical protein GOP47_0018035 [Adiantum capillus-veneris]|uniref:Uncharacterized protein n=1 Tax=Adiantum capillus-veneris TaxID=13818 RepID=A0A9D4ZB84_ADICA|nr:hypothetical protein GOP47_0018035 [Adiantum capillus-veneris]